MVSSVTGPVTANGNTSKEPPDASSGSRYRFRTDLEIVDIAGSDVTIIDGRTGQQHVFTADEFCLCRGADGNNTLAAIRRAFKAETGREISHGKVFTFFRLLRSLGLLEESAANKPEPAGPIPGGIKQASGETTGPSAKQDDSIATVGRGGLGEARSGDLGATFGAGGVRRPMLGGGSPGTDLGSVQNFLAGLAARARLGRRDVEAEDAADGREPARASLFNPDAALGVFAALTWPLKYVFVPLLLVVPAAIWIAYQHRDILVADIRAFDLSVVGTAILGLVIASLASRLTQGTFIRGFGAEVKQFGIALTFGIPRFFVDLGGIARLDRRGQLWVHTASLLARLGLFSAGTLLWFALRQSAPSLSHLALVVGQIGLFAFLISALPLLPSDGFRWLATYFGRPALRSDALRSISASFAVFGRPERPLDALRRMRQSSAAILFALAIVIAVSLLALVVQIYFDIATTGDVRLLTAALLLGLGVALAVWIIALRNYGRRHKIEVLDPGATRKMFANWTGQADLASDGPVSIRTVGKVFWAVILYALLAVAFLPYRYEAGGKFEILPNQRTVVAVRTSGEVEQVLVREGDWVKANQLLARLSSDDQQRAVTITSAELERAKAQLAQLRGKTDSQDDAALEQSVADGNEAASGSAKKDPIGTNYVRTEAERAARAEVERLTHKLAYERDQLSQTEVHAPKEGRVMTPNVHLLTGAWRARGSELLTLADTRTLEAEINLPEADIGLVNLGDKVRVRPWSDDDSDIVGTVTGIAPAAQAKPYGQIVRVRASIPNHEAFLLPGLTGYAKIDGQDMRVWEAFLRRIIRIVRVEMWSWIP
jgi:RND family efflux transporter MFP subunit